MDRSVRLRAGAWGAALMAGALSGGAPPRAAELPPFPADPAVLARARAVQALPCGGGDAVDGFAPDRSAPAAWRLGGALVSVRRAGKDRFAFVLGRPAGGAADCAVEDVIPLPRNGQLLECSLPSGRVAGLGVHALLESGGRHLLLWSSDGGTGLRRGGEDKSNETDTGELICALPDTSGPPPARAADAASARPDLGAAGVALALLGMALTYAVLGAPLRAAVGLMGAPPASAGRRIPEAAAALASRTALAFLAFGLLSLPGAGAVGGLVVLACLVAALRPPRRAPPPPDAAAEPPSRVALVIAALINDGSAALAGLFCLAILARHEPRLVVTGVALALVASVPRLILRRRRLRRAPRAWSGAAALLAAVVGLSASTDPGVAAVVGQAIWPRLLAPLLFAAVVGGSGLSRALPIRSGS